MSKKNYTQFTKEEFERALDETNLFFNIVNYDWSNEYIYENESKNGRFSIRVYSSIDQRTNKARDSGSDAIRVVVIDNETNKPVMKQRRVNRIETWSKNLKKRINKIRDAKDELKYCSECGSLMVIRQRKDDKKKFWGCTLYPECNNAENLE